MAVWTFIGHPPIILDWVSGCDTDREGLVALDETRIHPLRLVHHLDLVETPEDLLPDNLQLQLGKSHADAAMDAEAERQMGAGAGAVDHELVRRFDHRLVAVARNVPHHDLVALPDLLAAELDVLQGGAAHMRER